MPPPNVLSWVKEPRHLARLWIDRSKIRSFISVTNGAAEHQVIFTISAAVLLRNDMVELMRD
jgi:hypothetical protein